MSSSKIQSRNLDPNMDLAKESSVQQILEKVENGVDTKTMVCEASDTVQNVLISSEVSATTNTLISKIAVNMKGYVKLTASAKSSNANQKPMFEIKRNGTNIGAPFWDNTTTYVTRTTNINVQVGDVFEILFGSSYNNVPAYCNLVTLSYDLFSIDNPVTVL